MKTTPILLVPILALAVLGSVAPLGAADDRLELKLDTARIVLEEMMSAPDREVPATLLEKARCIAVIPGVIKGAFGWGGRHGRGVVSCRESLDRWSAPAFMSLSGASFGWQIGAESSDVVLFFMGERGVRSLLSSKVTLGADASVAAGPVGRQAQAGTDLKLNAEIYSYARSRGLFAGVSLEGARLAPDPKRIRRFYGERLFAEEILFEGRVTEVPAAARSFIDSMP